MYIEGLVEDLDGLQNDLDNSLSSLHPCQRELVKAVLEILKYSFGKVSETNYGCCQDICLATTCWDLPEGYDTEKLQDDVAFIVSLSNIGFGKNGAKADQKVQDWWDSNDQHLTKAIVDCITQSVLDLLGSDGLDILDETDPAMKTVAQALLAGVLFLVFGDPVVILHNSDGLLSDENLEKLLNDAIKRLTEILDGTPVPYQEVLQEIGLYNGDPTDLSSTNFTPERFLDLIRWLLQDFQYAINQVEDLKNSENSGSGDDPCPDNQFGLRFPSWPGFLWMLGNVTVGVLGGALWGLFVKKRWEEEGENGDCPQGGFPPIGLQDINHPAWMNNLSAPSHPFADQAFRITKAEGYTNGAQLTDPLERVQLEVNYEITQASFDLAFPADNQNGTQYIYLRVACSAGPGGGAGAVEYGRAPVSLINGGKTIDIDVDSLEWADGTPIQAQMLACPIYSEEEDEWTTGHDLAFIISEGTSFGTTPTVSLSHLITNDTDSPNSEMVPFTGTWTSSNLTSNFREVKLYASSGGDENDGYELRRRFPPRSELSDWLLGHCECPPRTFNLGIGEIPSNTEECNCQYHYFALEDMNDGNLYYTSVTNEYILEQDGRVYWNGGGAYTVQGQKFALRGYGVINGEINYNSPVGPLEIPDALCCPKLEIDECGIIRCCPDVVGESSQVLGQIGMSVFCVGEPCCPVDLHCGLLFEDLCGECEESGTPQQGFPCFVPGEGWSDDPICDFPPLIPHEVTEGESTSNIMLFIDYVISAYEQYFGDDFKVIFAAIGATGLLNKKTADFCGFLHPDAMCAPFLEKFICQLIMSQCETECIEVDVHGKLDNQPHPGWAAQIQKLTDSGELTQTGMAHTVVPIEIYYSQTQDNIGQASLNEIAAFTVNGDHLVAARANAGGNTPPNNDLYIHERPTGASLPLIEGEEIYFMFYEAQSGRAFTLSDIQHTTGQSFSPLTIIADIANNGMNSYGVLYSPLIPDHYYAVEPEMKSGGSVDVLNRMLLRADEGRRGFQLFDNGSERCLVWIPQNENCDNDCGDIPHYQDDYEVFYVLDAVSKPTTNDDITNDRCGQDAWNPNNLGTEQCATQRICVGDACCVWIKENGDVMADGTKVGTVGLVSDTGSKFDDISPSIAGTRIYNHNNWSNYTSWTGIGTVSCLFYSHDYGDDNNGTPKYWDVYDLLIRDPETVNAIVHHDDDDQAFLDCEDPQALRDWLVNSSDQFPFAMFEADTENPTGYNCCPTTFEICDCTVPVPSWLKEWFDKYCCYLYVKLPYDPCNPNDCARYSREEQIMLVTAFWELIETFLDNTPFGIAFGFKDWPNSMTRFLNIIPFGKSLIPKLNDTFGGWEVGCVPEPVELVLECTDEVCVDCCEWMCVCCDPCVEEEVGSGSGSVEEECGETPCDCCDCAIGVWQQPIKGDDLCDDGCAGYPLGAIVHYGDENGECYISLIGCEPDGGNYEPIFIMVDGVPVLNGDAWAACPSPYPDCENATVTLESGCCCYFETPNGGEGEGGGPKRAGGGDQFTIEVEDGCMGEPPENEENNGVCVEICSDAEAPCPIDWRYKLTHDIDGAVGGNDQEQQQRAAENQLAIDIIGQITRENSGKMTSSELSRIKVMMAMNNATLSSMSTNQISSLTQLNTITTGRIDFKTGAGLKENTIAAIRRVGEGILIRESVVNSMAMSSMTPEEVTLLVLAGEQKLKPDCVNVCVPAVYFTDTEWKVTVQYKDKHGEWIDCASDEICLCCMEFCDDLDITWTLDGDGEAPNGICCEINAAAAATRLVLDWTYSGANFSQDLHFLIFRPWDNQGVAVPAELAFLGHTNPTASPGLARFILVPEIDLSVPNGQPTGSGLFHLVWDDPTDANGSAFADGEYYYLMGEDISIGWGNPGAIRPVLIRPEAVDAYYGDNSISDCGEIWVDGTHAYNISAIEQVALGVICGADAVNSTQLTALPYEGLCTNLDQSQYPGGFRNFICDDGQGGTASDIINHVGEFGNPCEENLEGDGKCIELNINVAGHSNLGPVAFCADYRWNANGTIIPEDAYNLMRNYGSVVLCIPHGTYSLKLEYSSCGSEWATCWETGEITVEDCCVIDCDELGIAWTVTAPTNPLEACCDVTASSTLMGENNYQDNNSNEQLDCGDRINGETSSSDGNTAFWYDCVDSLEGDGQCYRVEAYNNQNIPWWTNSYLECACWRFVAKDSSGTQLAEWMLANTMPNAPGTPFLNLCLPINQVDLSLEYQYSEDGGSSWVTCWQQTITTEDCCEIDCDEYFVQNPTNNLNITWTADGCCDDTNIADCSGTANENGECATVNFSVIAGKELCESVFWTVQLMDVGNIAIVDTLYTGTTLETSISFNETRCLAQGQYKLVVTLTDSLGVVICESVIINSPPHITAQCCDCELSVEILGSTSPVTPGVSTPCDDNDECCCLALRNIKHYGTEHDPLGGSDYASNPQDPCETMFAGAVGLPARCVKITHETDCTDQNGGSGLYWRYELNRRIFNLQGQPEQMQWKVDVANGYGFSHTCNGPCGNDQYPNNTGGDGAIPFVDNLKPPTWVLADLGTGNGPEWIPENDTNFNVGQEVQDVTAPDWNHCFVPPQLVTYNTGSQTVQLWSQWEITLIGYSGLDSQGELDGVFCCEKVIWTADGLVGTEANFPDCGQYADSSIIISDDSNGPTAPCYSGDSMVMAFTDNVETYAFEEVFIDVLGDAITSIDSRYLQDAITPLSDIGNTWTLGGTPADVWDDSYTFSGIEIVAGSGPLLGTAVVVPDGATSLSGILNDTGRPVISYIAGGGIGNDTFNYSINPSQAPGSGSPQSNEACVLIEIAEQPECCAHWTVVDPGTAVVANPNPATNGLYPYQGEFEVWLEVTHPIDVYGWEIDFDLNVLGASTDAAIVKLTNAVPNGNANQGDDNPMSVNLASGASDGNPNPLRYEASDPANNNFIDGATANNKIATITYIFGGTTTPTTVDPFEIDLDDNDLRTDGPGNPAIDVPDCNDGGVAGMSGVFSVTNLAAAWLLVSTDNCTNTLYQDAGSVPSTMTLNGTVLNPDFTAYTFDYDDQNNTQDTGSLTLGQNFNGIQYLNAPASFTPDPTLDLLDHYVSFFGGSGVPLGASWLSVLGAQDQHAGPLITYAPGEPILEVCYLDTAGTTLTEPLPCCGPSVGNICQPQASDVVLDTAEGATWYSTLVAATFDGGLPGDVILTGDQNGLPVNGDASFHWSLDPCQFGQNEIKIQPWVGDIVNGVLDPIAVDTGTPAFQSWESNERYLKISWDGGANGMSPPICDPGAFYVRAVCKYNNCEPVTIAPFYRTTTKQKFFELPGAELGNAECWNYICVFQRTGDNFGGQGTGQTLGGANSYLTINYSSGGIMRQKIVQGGSFFQNPDPQVDPLNGSTYHADEDFVTVNGEDNLGVPWTWHLRDYDYEQGSWSLDAPPPAGWVEELLDFNNNLIPNPDYDGKRSYVRVIPIKIDSEDAANGGFASLDIELAWTPDPQGAMEPMGNGGIADAVHGGHICAPGNIILDNGSNPGRSAYFYSSVPPESGGPECCQNMNLPPYSLNFSSGNELGASIASFPDMGVFILNSIGDFQKMDFGYSNMVNKATPVDDDSSATCGGIWPNYCPQGGTNAMWAAAPFRYLSGRGADGAPLDGQHGPASETTSGDYATRCYDLDANSSNHPPTSPIIEPWKDGTNYDVDAIEFATVVDPQLWCGAGDDHVIYDFSETGGFGSATPLAIQVLDNDAIANYGTNPGPIGGQTPSIQITIVQPAQYGLATEQDVNVNDGYGAYINYEGPGNGQGPPGPDNHDLFMYTVEYFLDGISQGTVSAIVTVVNQ